eukprot:TRINITY_DN8874_c0_g1_i2.p1 TRINITY_DN8874_c0_g1~~TRINITY_DN8874_c0_g1_i2.p1  ORF type:complete len:380 (+),score=145.86 TRINITY_DN8874_c0_g1_i2:207-1346(+)
MSDVEVVPVAADEWWVVFVRERPGELVLYMLAVVIIWWILALVPPFKGIAFKMNAFSRGFVHMLARREGKVRKADIPHPEQLKGETEIEEKEFIFIRHGESEWNEIFNRGKAMLLPRLLIGIARELFMFPMKDKSLFLDSPLCATGFRQAQTLKEALEKVNPTGQNDQQGTALLPLRVKSQKLAGGRSVESVVFSSTLKRCVETALICLEPRLRDHPTENVKVFSSLQEVAPNIDTLSLTKKGEIPKVSKKIPADLRGRINAAFNLGSKMWFERSITRMEAFLKFAFAEKERRIIVSGHSFYFRELFKRHMDEQEARGVDAAMKARTMKIRNCGVVRCVIQKGQMNTSKCQVFRIKPDSIQVLFPCPEPTDPKLQGFVK